MIRGISRRCASNSPRGEVRSPVSADLLDRERRSVTDRTGRARSAGLDPSLTRQSCAGSPRSLVDRGNRRIIDTPTPERIRDDRVGDTKLQRIARGYGGVTGHDIRIREHEVPRRRRERQFFGLRSTSDKTCKQQSGCSPATYHSYETLRGLGIHDHWLTPSQRTRPGIYSDRDAGGIGADRRHRTDPPHRTVAAFGWNRRDEDHREADRQADRPILAEP